MRRLVIALTLLLFPATAVAGEQTFGAAGAEQTFVVPAGVSSLHVVAVGAPGGRPLGNNGAPGAAGTATADLAVFPGEVLFVEVGGPGAPGAVPGGFNGGGNASGGGASDVRTVARGADSTLESRVVVAGGGGAGALSTSAAGGTGGGLVGTNGGNYPTTSPPCATTANGKGATQTGGGAAGNGDGAATAGTFGTGGNGGSGEAGGGGGWWGGGGGANCGGGGGGSGHFGPGTNNGVFGAAAAGDASRVTVSYADPVVVTPTPAPTVAATPAPAPDVTITKHPKATIKTRAKRVKVHFYWTATDERATFRCTLDGGNSAACDSGRGYTVKPGKHAFTVAATLNSVRDPTPARFAFTVKKSKMRKHH